MKVVPYTIAALSMAVVLTVSLKAHGGHGCCARCGCHGPCHKICRLVCEEKKVEVVCWGMKCEDFCLPCPGKPCCEHCEQVCVDCEACEEGISTRPQKFVWKSWCPSSAKMFSKTKLMKRVEVKKIPTYKWVVEDLCPRCQAKKPAETADAAK